MGGSVGGDSVGGNEVHWGCVLVHGVLDCVGCGCGVVVRLEDDSVLAVSSRDPGI